MVDTVKLVPGKGPESGHWRVVLDVGHGPHVWLATVKTYKLACATAKAEAERRGAALQVFDYKAWSPLRQELKWLETAQPVSVVQEPYNRPLCKVYKRKKVGQPCEGCPIAVRTGVRDCAATPLAAVLAVPNADLLEDKVVYSMHVRLIASQETFVRALLQEMET